MQVQGFAAITVPLCEANREFRIPTMTAVGFSMDGRMPRELMVNALRMALFRSKLAPVLLRHSVCGRSSGRKNIVQLVQSPLG